MTNESIITQKNPFQVELKSDNTYYWCACGRSKSQPFCDGSHKGSGIEPTAFTAQETGTAYLCGCKQTATPPFCDGTHKNL